jgi:hypothetical protein
MVITALCASDFAGGTSAAAQAHGASNVVETKKLQLKRTLIPIGLLPFNKLLLDGEAGFR